MQPLSRMTSPTIDVLRALRAEGDDIWGLRIVKATGRPAGTVYPILERLERAGWVQSCWESDEERTGPRRRLYRFTPDGATAAVDVIARNAHASTGSRPVPGHSEGRYA